MKIFIPSKDRPATISSHRYFSGCDYYVVVHDKKQFDAYVRSSSDTLLDPQRILCSNTPADAYGLTRQREWVCQYEAKDRWMIFADDNIKAVQAVPGDLYWQPSLPVQDDKSLRAVYNTFCPADKFLHQVIPDCVSQCEDRDVSHMGFATTDNFFFRGKKWHEVGYIIGKLMLWKNDGRLTFDHTITMEDFELTAQSILKFGIALVNTYVYPMAGHYEAGGMGTKDQRQAVRTQDIALLKAKYPGLFAEKAGSYPDLSLRVHTYEGAYKWRRQMKVLRGLGLQ